MQVHGAAHHFADIHGAVEHLAAVAQQGDVLGADAQSNGLRLDIVLFQIGLLLVGEGHGHAVQHHGVLAVLLRQLRIKEVHLGNADEAGDEQVGGMIEDLLRRADLLDDAVAHDDDTVAQGHGFGLVMGDIEEGTVDALA